MPVFIHIGKTGGTTINELLRPHYKDFKQYHLRKDYKFNEKYIIWIRNPISRFVSAFNMSYVNINYKDYFTNNREILTANNSVISWKTKRYIKGKRDYIISHRYDELINFFGSANKLAEGLSSSDISVKEKATELMNIRHEHIFKGIGWYLNNGKFVKNRSKRIIFVGKQEAMTQDINKMGSILNINIKDKIKARENSYLSDDFKYLSPLAIKNIIEFYKDTDYAALIELKNHGWITQETLDSYYIYLC